jgi:hypothetical protein
LELMGPHNFPGNFPLPTSHLGLVGHDLTPRSNFGITTFAAAAFWKRPIFQQEPILSMGWIEGECGCHLIDGGHSVPWRSNNGYQSVYGCSISGNESQLTYAMTGRE